MSPCKYCQDYCFGNCTKSRESQHPERTSTQPPLPVINSWAQFLGDYSPENPLNPAINYNVIWKDGRVFGQWFCTLCHATDKDIHTVTRHIDSEHRPGANINCRLCSASYTNMPDLDKHYSIMHADLMPVQCTECPIVCPDRAQLIMHLEWHRSEDRDTRSNNFASICCYCRKFFPNGPDFDLHTPTCTENGTPDTQGNDANITTLGVDTVHRFTYTQSTSNQISLETHTVPHTVN